MLKQLSRFDAGVARGEAALATIFLVAMILAASVQAVFRNLSGLEVDFATATLEYLTWVDPFLQKGTLWLAFLGASLATREGRHIGIDLFPRIAPKKTKLLMRAVAAFGAAVVSYFLSRAFWAAVLVNAEERPASYEVYGDEGSMHVCDASAQLVADAGLEMPGFFCSVRSVFEGIGVPIETPQAAMQLIVPVMFFVMAVRLLFNGGDAALKLYTGKIDDADEPPSPELKGRKSRAPEEPAEKTSAKPEEEE